LREEAGVSYRLLSHQSGREARAGILVEEQVYDPAGMLGNAGYTSVLAILQDWRIARPALALAAERIIAGKSRAKGVPVKRAKLLAPVLYPGNIYCAGANYTDHMAEMARAHGREPGPTMKERGEKPWHFIKASRSTVAGPGSKVKIPGYCQMMDWEVELAAVIGRTAKDVPVEKALDYVAGYTIADDLSARDAGRREKNPETSPFYMDWLGHKSFDGSCPLGPWITPAGDVADPQQLGIRLWVNGELMQDSHTSKMIFSTAEQIAMLSSRVTLNPGDLVLTGTPAGVGMGRQRFLKAGDSVKLWIEGIGDLTHTMA
jgi:2-keto-4-pentenoate hydratase/2-oxohepta-3-ene-1,7-dioic acid hydratase in catechol pathway